MKDLNYYINRFQKLRVDRSHGTPAPHKPILLLSLCQAFQNGVYYNNRIDLNLDILSLFRTNWSLLVKTHHSPQITYPFFHLRSEGFWKLVAWPNYVGVLSGSIVIKSFNKLNEMMQYAEIDEELSFILMERHSNMLLQQALLNVWFPNTLDNIQYLDSENQKYNQYLESIILHENSEDYIVKMKSLIHENNEEEIFVRGAIFKKEIPKIYNYTCSISGLRIDAPGLSLIDACHIVPFSESYNDTIVNGIALCPNLHRAFDRGLISISDEYCVIVSNKFIENNSDYSIKKYNNKRILLPNDLKFHPDKNNLRKHRIKFSF